MSRRHPSIVGADLVRKRIATRADDVTNQFFGARVLGRSGDCEGALAAVARVSDRLSTRDLKRVEGDLAGCSGN